MFDLDHVEALILRPPSSAFDREMLLELVQELREARAKLTALAAKVESYAGPGMSVAPPPDVKSIRSAVETWVEPLPGPTPPEKPKAKGRK